jgi:hypothetical protein
MRWSTYTPKKYALGDALTRVLGTSCIHQSMNEECITATKMGVHCLCGDFHCQMHHGGLIGKVLDRGLGVGSPGTHQSLRKSVGRVNASGNWKKTFSEDERLLTDIISVHVLGFAMRYFGMASPDANPTLNKPPPPADWQKMSLTERMLWFDGHMRAIVCGSRP